MRFSKNFQPSKRHGAGPVARLWRPISSGKSSLSSQRSLCLAGLLVMLADLALVARQGSTIHGSCCDSLMLGAVNFVTFACNAALFSKFIAGKRGFFVCAVISSAINPWYLLGSASIFLSFQASYQIFLSAITGVLLCNYYLIARRSLNMRDCLMASKSGCIITLEVGICEHISLHYRHHSEFLRLPEQHGCQRSSWHHALLLLCLFGWVVL